MLGWWASSTPQRHLPVSLEVEASRVDAFFPQAMNWEVEQAFPELELTRFGHVRVPADSMMLINRQGDTVLTLGLPSRQFELEPEFMGAPRIHIRKATVPFLSWKDSARVYLGTSGELPAENLSLDIEATESEMSIQFPDTVRFRADDVTLVTEDGPSGMPLNNLIVIAFAKSRQTINVNIPGDIDGLSFTAQMKGQDFSILNQHHALMERIRFVQAWNPGEPGSSILQATVHYLDDQYDSRLERALGEGYLLELREVDSLSIQALSASSSGLFLTAVGEVGEVETGPDQAGKVSIQPSVLSWIVRTRKWLLFALCVIPVFLTSYLFSYHRLHPLGKHRNTAHSHP